MALTYLKKVRALDEGRAAFVKRRTIKGNRPASAWIAFFDPLTTLDQQGDRVRKQFGVAAIVSTLGAFPAVIIGAQISTAVLVLAGVLAVVAAVCTIMYFVLRKTDLPNTFRQFVVPLLRLLREDMADGQVSLSLDLRGALLDEKKTNETSSSAGMFSYPKVKSWFFKDAWLDAECVFADGSKLSFTLTDFVEKRQTTRRGSRKVKTKTKHKVKRLLDATIALKRENLSFQENVKGDVRARSTDKRDIIRLRDEQRFIGLDKAADLQWFLHSIARVFRAAGRSAA